MQNGPVHAYREMVTSPYYHLFIYNERTLSFYQLDRKQGDCIDEQAWMNRCNREGFTIDMPMVQGALNIVNCFDETSCWFTIEDSA